MSKKFSMYATMLCLLFVSAAQSQTKSMTWSTKSGKARELATKAVNHMMNLELPQAYEYVKQAIDLDPDFTVALVFMANLSSGSIKKAYSAKAVKSSANKTEGEKLFASLVDTGMTQDSRRNVWAKLYNMFPEDRMMGVYYIFSRATPGEQFTVGEELVKKFPNEPALHNIMAYLYLQEKKDTALAKTYFEKYIAMYPAGCNPYDSMGEFYFLTGDMDNSEKYYKMALEKYPFNASSTDKLKEIDAAKEKNKVKAASN
jgi:tetratricopeptide (TPR) repeat protein